MIGKTIQQDRVVDRAGQRVAGSLRSRSVTCSDPFIGPCWPALRRAATGSKRGRLSRRGCSILFAALLTITGAASDLGRGESASPRVLRSESPRPSEAGLASWYGHPYHGRKAANGERYDMDRLTAAHRSLPFGTRVRVHSLRSGKTVEVRITDRGPFVEGRLIDLSRAAARVLGFQRAGLELVRLEVLPGTAVSPPSESQTNQTTSRLRGTLEHRTGSQKV